MKMPQKPLKFIIPLLHNHNILLDILIRGPLFSNDNADGTKYDVVD